MISLTSVGKQEVGNRFLVTAERRAAVAAATHRSAMSLGLNPLKNFRREFEIAFSHDTDFSSRLVNLSSPLSRFSSTSCE